MKNKQTTTTRTRPPRTVFFRDEWWVAGQPGRVGFEIGVICIFWGRPFVWLPGSQVLVCIPPVVPTYHTTPTPLA
ncbi:MAG: hypothetical protein EI684_21455 [Candidatus Viridilinea halotolerans]|uniref:Uncharacterized protein n=1 Tax=Candidatus Viridilinea halotolerans TaxID=2491704 RepID=A0A426TRE9_9CHLR|nr:MAG: hypothetical protein EI684_21455 [Candidatus Viridilinea halotolerans]